MRRVRLIGLAGAAGCGKDALADHLVAEFGYEKLRFAGFLYKMVTQLPHLEEHRWLNRDWKETTHPFYGVSPRRMLQTLGTEWGRDNVNENIWIKLVEYSVNARLSSTGFVFPDMRFSNESSWLRSSGGLSVKLVRPSGGSIKDATALAHISESYAGMHFDKVIVNDQGLQELKDNAFSLDTLARAATRKS